MAEGESLAIDSLHRVVRQPIEEFAWIAGDGVYSQRTDAGSILLVDVNKNETRILVDGDKIRDVSFAPRLLETLTDFVVGSTMGRSSNGIASKFPPICSSSFSTLIGRNNGDTRPTQTFGFTISPPRLLVDFVLLLTLLEHPSLRSLRKIITSLTSMRTTCTFYKILLQKKRQTILSE